VPREILAGRVFNKKENLESAAVTVLTEYGARKLLATRNSIGQTIKIGSDYFEVIGIIKPNQAGWKHPDTGPASDAYIPLNTVRNITAIYSQKEPPAAEQQN